MATETSELAIILKAVNQATAPIREVQQEMNKLQGVIGKFLPGITILAGVTAGINFLKDALQEAGAEELQLRNLQSAIENQGVAWNSVKGQITTYAEALQLTTQYMDSDVYTAMQRFINSGMDSAEAMKAMSTAMDFATARGIDLETAATLLGKAYTGHTEMLQRYGIEGKNFAAIMDELNNKFGGMAQANMDTYAGQVHKLKAAWDELKETIGNELLPTITNFIAILSGGATWIKQNWDGVKNIFNTLLSSITAALPGVKLLFEVIKIGTKEALKSFNETYKQTLKEIQDSLQNVSFTSKPSTADIKATLDTEKAVLIEMLASTQYTYAEKTRIIQEAVNMQVISESEGASKVADLNRQKVDATRQAQSEINQMTMDEVSFMKFQMNEKVEAMRKAGVDEVTINQWVAAMNIKIKSAEIKQIANLTGAMGDFFMAVARASASGALKVASVVMSGVKAALLAIEALMAASGPIGIILGILGLGTAVATTIAAIRELEEAEKGLKGMPEVPTFKPGEITAGKPGTVTTPTTAPERVERQPAPINNVYYLNYTLEAGIMLGESSIIDNAFSMLMKRYDERKSLVGA